MLTKHNGDELDSHVEPLRRPHSSSRLHQPPGLAGLSEKVNSEQALTAYHDFLFPMAVFLPPLASLESLLCACEDIVQAELAGPDVLCDMYSALVGEEAVHLGHAGVLHLDMVEGGSFV